MAELPRNSTPIITELLEGFRAVLVNGPRQSGKSTLLNQIQKQRGEVISLDDPSNLDLALNDPNTFVNQLPPKSAIDEFQRGGDPLLLAIKAKLDSSNEPGQLLLAGSTHFLTTQKISETLTGRIGIVDLLPLSVGEIKQTKETFLETIFTSQNLTELQCEKLTRLDYANLISIGGFPELTLGPDTQRFRTSWLSSYIQTVTAKNNVEQVADLRQLDLIRSLLDQVAARSAGELVIADYAKELQTDESTIKTYLSVLETIYLIRQLPAWTTSSTNRSKRRKVSHILDTAIACFLLNQTSENLTETGNPWIGPFLESFVTAEIAKQISWTSDPTSMRQFRDRYGNEVDIILEKGQSIVGIEVKATATPLTKHTKHLKYIRDKTGNRFKNGILLHTGTQTLQLEDRITALPISALWADPNKP